MYWHVRYLQNEKDYLMSSAAEVMEAAGFDDPVTGESEVFGSMGDVSGFIGVIWQREGPESEPPFWTIVMVAAGGDPQAAVGDLVKSWEEHMSVKLPDWHQE
jgi:hypothetical protein